MKDIDSLKKKSRGLREFNEKIGSTGLAGAGLIGLLFLGVLVWQIAAPTVIDGEVGEIEPATECIPESEHVMKWSNPTVDENGNDVSEPVIIKLSWEYNGKKYSEEVSIDVTDERYLTNSFNITEQGIDKNSVVVGKKTSFYIISTINVPVSVEQISGPVPAADETGYPLVDTFVISYEINVLFADGEPVFEILELIGYLLMFSMVIIYSYPSENVLIKFSKLIGKEMMLKYSLYVIAVLTIVLAGGLNVSSFFGALAWILSAILILRMLQGIERMMSIGRELSETSRLKHSISNRDGLLMWSRLALVASTLFIPISIDIPFLTERYQDIFLPYSSGIRAAFYGTIYVMSIAMIVSIPISIGAAIYLEEYASPTRMTKLIQALVTNLAGVPSIVFGMFGLAIFVKQGGIGWGLGPSVLAAGLTMGVMAMPIIVLAGQEALRSVPRSLRESAYGVGCTKWEVTKDHVLPSAMPGMMTGSILAMSRIMGEAAPLMVVGAATVMYFDPEPLAAIFGGNADYTVIPLQIYFWTSEPGHSWHSMAAAASIALIVLIIAMNSIAIVLRQHFRKRLNS